MAVGLAPTFGQLLRQHRLHAGLSQEKLAEEAGLSVNQISDLERDRRARPHPDTLRRLADALRLSERERGDLFSLARPGKTPQLAPDQPTLPLPLTRFFARPESLSAVRGRLSNARLLTLTGAGGVGKTRLALEIAHAVVAEYPDGVWLIDLATLRDGAHVPQRVARTLGLPERPGQSADEALLAALQERRLLLLLDNCEHLLDACARLVADLLRHCPEVRVLATSREMLRIEGEQLWPVLPLAVPPADWSVSAEGVARYPAVALFADRAAAVEPGFALTADNAAAVAQICRLLDGIPLAVELAAARVPTLPLSELAARLEDRFRLLTEGSRAAPARHQTLRAALDWGVALLVPEEQALLWRLAVFVGGWTLAAAEGVAGAAEPGDEAAVADLLARLTAKSLVQLERAGEGVRYRLLEPIRQYAGERLAAAGEATAWQGRHATYFRALAEAAGPALATGERSGWLLRLEGERDNLRAALRWLIGQGDSAPAVRLAAALGQFWHIRRSFREGRQWLEAALALHPPAPDDVRAGALEWLGVLSREQGDYAAGRAALEESRDLFARLDDRHSYATVLRHLGMLALNQESPDFARAAALFEECLAVRRALGFQHGIANSLNDLALVAGDQGDYALARRHLGDGLALARTLNAERLIVLFLLNCGLIDLLGGEDARARSLLHEALQRVVLPEDCNIVGYALAALAALASRAGRPERAARLAGASEGVCASINLVMPTGHRSNFDRHLAAARAQLDASTWATAWSTGFTLTAEEAVALALAER